MTALPLLFLPMAPFIDLPGHMGRYEVQLHLKDFPVLQNWYDFEWEIIPNLGFDIFIEIFGRRFGIEPTVRVLTTLTPVFLVAGLMACSKQLHGHVSPLVLFAFPLAYHFPFHFGFLNYSLALAFAFLAFAFWVFLAKHAHPAWRIIAFIPISAFIWVCHIYGWAILCILIGSFELTRHFERHKFSIKTIVSTSLFCLVLLTPYIIKFLFLNDGDFETGRTYGFFRLKKKLGYIINTVRDRWIVWDIGFIIFCLGWIIYACRNSKIRKSPSLILAGTIFMILFWYLPRTLLGSAYADMRLFPVIAMTFLTAFSFSQNAPKKFITSISAFALILFFARMIGNQISLKAYSNDVQAELKILDHIPQNANLVTFITYDCPGKKRWNKHRLRHLAAYPLLRKHAFANNQWDTPGGHLIRITRSANDVFIKAQKSYEFYPINCGKNSLGSKVELVPPNSFEYMWVVSREDEVLKNRNWDPVAKVRHSVLYRYAPKEGLQRPSPHTPSSLPLGSVK